MFVMSVCFLLFSEGFWFSKKLYLKIPHWTCQSYQVFNNSWLLDFFVDDLTGLGNVSSQATHLIAAIGFLTAII